MTTERRKLAADAWGSVLRVHAALVPRLDRELRQSSGLPLTWYDVLLELDNAPGRRLRMSALADRVTLSRTRVSRLVDEMATAGLVARDEDPDDRRASFAQLTASGRSTFRRAAPLYLAAIESHFAEQLTDQDLRLLASVLSRVIRDS